MTTAEFPAARPLAMRISSGLRRRAAHVWWQLTSGQRPPAVPLAFEWLEKIGVESTAREGVPAVDGDPQACPGITGGLIATAATFGQHRLAKQWSSWLTSAQLRDGGFRTASRSQSLANTGSLVITGQALDGLLAMESQCPAVHAPARRAAQFLLSQLDLGVPTGCRQADLHQRLACLPPLWRAARRWQETSWENAVRRLLGRCLSMFDVTHWVEPLHDFTRVVEALVRLDCTELARYALCLPAALQKSDGSVPALPGEPWVSTSGVAHLAAIWYQLEDPGRADRCLAWLRRRQNPSGGFCGSYGRRACYFPHRETAWTVKHFLDASLLQVQATFTQQHRLPNAIDLNDGRLQAVCRWMEAFPPAARIADVGCGKGRYLRALAGCYPRASLMGVDSSAAALESLPKSIAGLAGSLLQVPVSEATLDGAYAVESLEHSLLPRQAVDKLCRVVRPGGRVLIIDKDASRQPLSEHEPWEQWFHPDEVTNWLWQHCDDVRVEQIRHHGGAGGSGLFLAWTGRRRPAFDARQAA